MSTEPNTYNGEALKLPPVNDWTLAEALGLGRERVRTLPSNLNPPLYYGPLFVGPLPQLDPIDNVKTWIRGLDEIPPEHRADRAKYLLASFSALAVHEANRATVVARAIIAAQQLADDDYWRETALWGREFKTGDQLVQALLEHFKVPTTCDRLRHQRPAARLYMEIESLGLACPRCLTALEPFCRHGVAAYAAALQQFGQPPSERSAREFCTTWPGERPTRNRKPKPMETVFAQMKSALDVFRVRAEASPDPEFRRFYEILDVGYKTYSETTKPKGKRRDKSPNESDLPIYTEATSPVTFATVERDAGHYLSVQMRALPSPCLEVLTRRPPAVRGWRLIKADDGGFAYERHLPSNTSEANARWSEAYRWAVRACILLSAPLPERPVQSP